MSRKDDEAQLREMGIEPNPDWTAEQVARRLKHQNDWLSTPSSTPPPGSQGANWPEGARPQQPGEY